MPSRLGAAEWCEDLAYLGEALRREHRNPFHRTSREAFDDAVRRLRARIPSLAGHEVVVELARLVAMLGDGHTVLRLADVPGFRRYPLVLDRFGDGLFVRAVGREHGAAAGARLLAVGGTPAEEPYEAMRPLVSRDNGMGVRATAPALLTIPEVLHARGIIEAPDRTTVDLELRGGERVTLVLAPGDGLPAGMAAAPARRRPRRSGSAARRRRTGSTTCRTPMRSTWRTTAFGTGRTRSWRRSSTALSPWSSGRAPSA